MTVKVHQKIKEGEKERVQIFEGLVIKISAGHAADSTFTVRKVVEGIGVEKIFPINSPNVAKIEVIKKSKVRRAKLYYMRELFGKAARLKGRYITDEERKKEALVEKESEELAVKAEAEEAAKEAGEVVETPVEEAKV
jgi:large subunit ribosomal protein L19